MDAASLLETWPPMRSYGESPTAPRCAVCRHTIWHHYGLRQPGCTYLGTCVCVEFTDPHNTS